MTLKPIEYLPERHNLGWQRLDDFFKMFMKMNIKYAQVLCQDWEYTNAQSCRGSLVCYLGRHNLPIDVKTISGSVFLIRTDLEG